MSPTLQPLPRYELDRRNRVILAREMLIQAFLNAELDENAFKTSYDHNLQTELLIRKSRADTSDVYTEELQRLELPQETNIIDLAAAAARKRRDERALRYSRCCTICLTDKPCQRSVFRGCGHVICRACVEQMAMEAATAYRSHPSCPHCRKKSRVITFIEDLGKDYNEFMNKYIDDCKQAVTETVLREGLGSSAYREKSALSFLDGEINYDQYAEKYETSFKQEASLRQKNGGLFADVWNEETRRVDSNLNTGSIIKRLGIAALEFYYKREKLQLIEHLRTEDAKIANQQYSRACAVCYSPAPRLRSIFKACAHAICRNCAQQAAVCPHCKKRSDVVNLFEDVNEVSDNVQ